MTQIAIEKKPKYACGGVGELLAIALPMMASSACDIVMTFTDRLFLSRLSSQHMNAAFAGGLMCFVMMTFFMGLIGYSTALVAQYFGSGQKRNCSVVVTQSVIIAVLAYPLILCLAPLARIFFVGSGIPPEQLALQTTYFNILVYATILGLLRSALSCFFSGIGRTRIIMVSSLVAMVVNVPANYILIFGKLGFPAMGIQGAAYGTIIGGVFCLAVLGVSYFLGKTRNEYNVGNSFRFDKPVMGKLLKFGYPAGLEFFLNVMAFNAMIVLFHAQGASVATAATITFNWDMVAFVPLIGIEIAVTSLVGRYMGAGNPDTAHASTMSGLKVGVLYSGIMLLIFLLFPVALVNIFRPDADSAVFAKAFPLTLFMVRTMAIYVLADAVVVTFCGALRGAGDTHWAMLASVVLHWAMVAVLFVMFRVVEMSAQNAWLVLIAWILLFSGVFCRRYRAGNWRYIKVIDSPPAEPLPIAEGFHEPTDL